MSLSAMRGEIDCPRDGFMGRPPGENGKLRAKVGRSSTDLRRACTHTRYKIDWRVATARNEDLSPMIRRQSGKSYRHSIGFIKAVALVCVSLYIDAREYSSGDRRAALHAN